MKTVTMERVVELDKIWLRECNAFLQQGLHYAGPSPFFIQEKYLDGIEINKMSVKWRVPREELIVYIALKIFINACADNDLEGMPTADEIADQMGIPLTVLNNYVDEQVKSIHDARQTDEDDNTVDWHDATAEDFEFDDEEDFLEGAAIQGE